MKGTEQFQTVIKSYLDKRAQEDELFRTKYEATTRTIEDVVTYIISEVQKSGRCGFVDEEIYSLATHAIDEPNLEIGERIACNVVVNPYRADRRGKGGAEITCLETLSERRTTKAATAKQQAKGRKAAGNNPTTLTI